jgi:NAD(P)-dependent dehydrogenase (short-subunit alcohol dehydrogenase family)
MQSDEQRVVIVTGAARGIGRGHALEFARQGYAVVVNDLGAEVDGSGSSNSPAGEVVEEIRRQVASGPDLLVLAGDVQSRQIVEGDLEHLGAEVVQLERGSRAEDGGDAALEEEIREVLRGRLITDRLDRLHELGQQLGRGTRMAVGIHDVAEAFVRGQVDTLYLDPVTSTEHELDPASYPGLAFGAVTLDGPVRADQALLAAACLTSADVLTAGTEHLFGTPVAAVLRWDQSG